MTEPTRTRPTRTKRAPPKPADEDSDEPQPKATVTRGRKRKAEEDEAPPVDEVEDLLTNPKGKLAGVDMTRLVNASTWACMSPDARAILSTMLPPAAFSGFRADVSATHPDKRHSRVSDESMDVDGARDGTVELDPAFLSSTFMEAALTTFQDNLVNGYFTKAHEKETEEYRTGLRAGTLHAEWKDDKWDEQQAGTSTARDQEPEKPKAVPPKPVPRLADLASKGGVAVGDILSYSRIVDSSVRLQKDVIVLSIHGRTHAVRVAFASSTVEGLPAHYLGPDVPQGRADDMEQVSVTTLSQLESTILEAMGRAELDPSEDPWDSFTLWRGVDVDNLGDGEKGGRRSLGKLTIIRDSYTQ
ncbi:hypothetical protein EXIGLDRAFT_725705, partial [Exidia glandulosa HHB12029]